MPHYKKVPSWSLSLNNLPVIKKVEELCFSHQLTQVSGLYNLSSEHFKLVKSSFPQHILYIQFKWVQFKPYIWLTWQSLAINKEKEENMFFLILDEY